MASSTTSDTFARREAPRSRDPDIPRGVSSDSTTKSRARASRITGPPTPRSSATPELSNDEIDFDIADTRETMATGSPHPSIATSAGNHLPSPDSSMDGIQTSSPTTMTQTQVNTSPDVNQPSANNDAVMGSANENGQREIKDELDIIQENGRPMYATARDGARLTHKVPKPTHFVRRMNGLVSPLIAVDELPPYMSIPTIPRTTSEEGLTSRFENAVVLPGMFPRSLQPYEPSNAFPAAAHPPDPQNNVRPDANDFNFAGPTHETGFGPGTAAPEPSKLVPANSDWEARAGRYVQLLHNQWARAGKVVPGTEGDNIGAVGDNGQVYNPLTPGVFGRKIFCSHWIRTGECDFTQQGCNYLHCMPDLDTMEKLGMKSYPRWLRELPRHEQIQLCADFDPKGLHDVPSGGRGGRHVSPFHPYHHANRNDRTANNRDRRNNKFETRRTNNGPRTAPYPMAPPPVPGMAPPNAFPNPGHQNVYSEPYNYIPRDQPQPQYAPPVRPYDGLARPHTPLVSEFGGSAAWLHSRPATPAAPVYQDNSSDLMDFDRASMHGGPPPLPFNHFRSRHGSRATDARHLAGELPATNTFNQAAVRENAEAQPINDAQVNGGTAAHEAAQQTPRSPHGDV